MEVMKQYGGLRVTRRLRGTVRLMGEADCLRLTDSLLTADRYVGLKRVFEWMERLQVRKGKKMDVKGIMA